MVEEERGRRADVRRPFVAGWYHGQGAGGGRRQDTAGAPIGVAAATRRRHCTAAPIDRVAFDRRRYSPLIPGRAAAAGIGHADLHAPQEQGDLAVACNTCWMRSAPVVIIGTDIPAITPAHIMAAFRMLGSAQCVFGPATDGGYWLVGMRRRPHVPRPFDGVRWSSPHALADTLANLAGQPVGFVATLCDVDDAAALSRFGGFARRTVAAGPDQVTRA